MKQTSKQIDIAIIGGGASGLFAAIHARKTNANATITIFEANDRIGRKLLATGNGRCNMSNMNVVPADYKPNESFVIPALSQCMPEELQKDFSDMGLLTTTDDMGRMYPITNQASCVLDCLRFTIENYTIQVLTNINIDKIEKKESMFLLNNTYLVKKVIIACGGKSSPNLSNNGGGYALLSGLGHQITPLFPGLVPLTAEGNFFSALKGIRVFGKMTLLYKGKEVYTDSGEIQFTDYGVSGIVTMQVSRHIAHLKQQNKTEKPILHIDYLPHFTNQFLLDLLSNLINNNPNLSLSDALNGIIPKRLAQVLLKKAGFSPLSKKVGALSEKELDIIVKVIKEDTIQIKNLRDMKWAQITVGGAHCEAFDENTLASKIVSNLFACGEVLAIDGPSGGYNLHWAFASGKLAGISAAKNI